jgi:hypothetical protein
METFSFDFYPVIAFVIFLIIHMIIGKSTQAEGNESDF